ncbi:unnamed protein product [Lactuca virosa]|uniref:Uncharacterized protein n=1 Tax=Lactuca virosa TaxID=75947 RepID=A0AAU9ND56_9ASTR|nr:unnamed protein product [Lactuca virosa]
MSSPSKHFIYFFPDTPSHFHDHLDLQVGVGLCHSSFSFLASVVVISPPTSSAPPISELLCEDSQNGILPSNLVIKNDFQGFREKNYGNRDGNNTLNLARNQGFLSDHLKSSSKTRFEN